MPSLWKFGGLTPIKLTQLTVNKIGTDELSTRSAALSYYFLLALFPMLSVHGIGPVLADRIISGRPYASRHELIER